MYIKSVASINLNFVTGKICHNSDIINHEDLTISKPLTAYCCAQILQKIRVVGEE